MSFLKVYLRTIVLCLIVEAIGFACWKEYKYHHAPKLPASATVEAPPTVAITSSPVTVIDCAHTFGCLPGCPPERTKWVGEGLAAVLTCVAPPAPRKEQEYIVTTPGVPGAVFVMANDRIQAFIQAKVASNSTVWTHAEWLDARNRCLKYPSPIEVVDCKVPWDAPTRCLWYDSPVARMARAGHLRAD